MTISETAVVSASASAGAVSAVTYERSALLAVQTHWRRPPGWNGSTGSLSGGGRWVLCVSSASCAAFGVDVVVWSELVAGSDAT